MTMTPRLANLFVCCVVLACVGWSPLVADDADVPASAADAQSFKRTLQPFLKSYCVKCHGVDEQNAERRFDMLAAQIRDDSTLVDYQDILDQLNLSTMPPADAKQPSPKERRTVVDWLTNRIATFHREHKPTSDETVLRRLNSREYRNTVRDLLHLNMTMFDPTAAFPRDQTIEHLDNVGEALVTSGHLLSRYLDAAEQVVDKAMQPLERPSVQTWTFRDGFRQQPEIDKVHQATNGFSRITLYDVIGADKQEGAYGPILAFKEGVPHDGVYEIRVKAEAVNRINPYDPEFLGLDPEEPFRLGIVAGNSRAGSLHKPQPMEPLLAEVELADEAEWYTVRVWLDQGYTPRFTFQNGLMDVRSLWSRVIKQYPDLFPKLKSRGIVEARFTAIKHGKLPQIQIHEVEIEGPFLDEWPKPSQRALLGDDWERVVATNKLPDTQIRRHLSKFVTRAYRRPARDDEIDRLVQLIQVRQEGGRSLLDAWGDAMKAVMCSPSFLFLDEQVDDGRLSLSALASRLSYFLWSSMPDDELTALASSGRLREPDVLDAQVERMLIDPRSEAFIDGFLDSWLTLRDLGSMPPDRGNFRDFYHYDLGPAMRRETELFTRHLLDENLSVMNFLDADFTFVNKPLARLYDIQPPEGDGFERVSLPDRRRGGLLGQASVLTVTANGIDTSPVVRGVWLLENILGTPPSPPPPDVEPLDPDVRGAKTIRDQLKLHRSTASCNDCHRKIDPLGFALENFDPIGRWRKSYARNTPIDASGELPGGKDFDDVVGLKAILAEQRETFVRALSMKLMAYAMGRHLEPADRPHIDQLIERSAQQDNGFRDLVKEVVASEPFRSP